jgi:hypothetical protein
VFLVDQIIVFPDFIPEGTTRSANHVCYVDNITFSAKAAPVAATAYCCRTNTSN